jgi:hypothetical protein
MKRRKVISPGIRIQRLSLDVVEGFVIRAPYVLAATGLAVVFTAIAVACLAPETGTESAISIAVDLVTSNSPVQYASTWHGYRLAPLVGALMWSTHCLGWLIVPALVGAVVSLGQEQIQLRAKMLSTLDKYLDKNRVTDKQVRNHIIDHLFEMIDNPESKPAGGNHG